MRGHALVAVLHVVVIAVVIIILVVVVEVEVVESRGEHEIEGLCLNM